jgi:hypothetical protein
LGGGRGHPGYDELKPAAGFKRSVGKIAMVAGGNEEHTQFVDRESGEKIRPFKGKKEDTQGGEVNQAERNEGDQMEAGSIGERDRQGSCDGGHRTLLLRGNAAIVVRARKSRAAQRQPPIQFTGRCCGGREAANQV